MSCCLLRLGDFFIDDEVWRVGWFEGLVVVGLEVLVIEGRVVGWDSVIWFGSGVYGDVN